MCPLGATNVYRCYAFFKMIITSSKMHQLSVPGASATPTVYPDNELLLGL